jgi:hypothetical protein
MSKGGKKQTGAGAQGKGAGAEVNSEIPKDKAGENMVLSRRIPTLRSTWHGQQAHSERAVAESRVKSVR